MGKKGYFFVFLLGMMMVLSACSGKTEKASSVKSKQIEATIENASYIIPSALEDKNQDVMAVNLSVKNVSKKPIMLLDKVKLYDEEGVEISSKLEYYDDAVGLENNHSGNIGAGKIKKILCIFEAEKDKEYEMGLLPMSADYEGEQEEVLLKFDTKKYAKTHSTLKDPEKAFQAYIDQIYLDKENKNYEKLVNADKPALKESFKKTFNESIKKLFTEEIPDEELEELFVTYHKVLVEKAKVTAETHAHANDKAIVTFDVTTVPINYELYDVIRKYENEFRENTGSFDRKERQKYALSKFETIINSQELKSNDRKIQVSLTKKDGKWIIENVNKYGDSLDDVIIKGDF
ncbi:uncharacterized protein YcfL [Oikeobacillus pervagus]|uniref:Uncharacterized protein YcfL n=1 Tax=Oikeobacillus pervagus TaxID=1325931 RepID=A0AAJ1WJE0_9BACI|nr:DUF5105 domain-containing protein [Oikeobacillus pervagus]MDQ0215353.1 uncharacterized protein YcfL [Oikeobacillus pervagus]